MPDFPDFPDFAAAATQTLSSGARSMITKLLSALPREFEFYHLGKVRLQDARETAAGPEFRDAAYSGEDSDSAAVPGAAVFAAGSEDQVPAIGYRFHGDVNGALILRVPGGADVSVYAEMGNIIASQVANRLAAADSLDVMISAPNFLSSSALRKLTGGLAEPASRVYLHHAAGAEGKGAIAISTWIVADPSETSVHSAEVGNV